MKTRRLTRSVMWALLEVEWREWEQEKARPPYAIIINKRVTLHLH